MPRDYHNFKKIINLILIYLADECSEIFFMFIVMKCVRSSHFYVSYTMGRLKIQLLTVFSLPLSLSLPLYPFQCPLISQILPITLLTINLSLLHNLKLPLFLLANEPCLYPTPHSIFVLSYHHLNFPSLNSSPCDHKKLDSQFLRHCLYHSLSRSLQTLFSRSNTV